MSVPVAPSIEHQKSLMRALSIWMVDTFSFTPWYTCELSRALMQEGTNLRLICSPLHREPAYYTAHGLHPRPGPVPSPPGRAPRWASQVMRLTQTVINQAALRSTLRNIPEVRPDVIHLQQLPLLQHGIRLDFRLVKQAQRLGIPVVHTVHNVLPHDHGDKSRQLYARLYREVDHLICHSNSAAERLVAEFAISRNKITIIPHGPLFAPASPSTVREQTRARVQLKLPFRGPIFLFQGILAAYKGIDVLLRAWELGQSTWPADPSDWPILLIAGSGSRTIEAQVRQAAERSGGSIQAHLHYVNSAAVADYFHAADVLVYPYRDITTSGSLLTGLCFAKPIIASDLRPFGEFLKHGRNALLTCPGDAVALATCLHELTVSFVNRGRELEVDGAASRYATLSKHAMGNPTLIPNWHIIARRTLNVYRMLLPHPEDISGGISPVMQNSAHLSSP